MSVGFESARDLAEKKRQSESSVDRPVMALPKEIVYRWFWGDEERVDLTGEKCPLVKDMQGCAVLKGCKNDKSVDCGPRGYALHWRECPRYKASIDRIHSKENKGGDFIE
jgi:hypothetical protein